MSLPLRILDVAQEEAREQVCWYEHRQQGLGRRFLQALHATLLAIEQRPKAFSHLETVADDLPIHRATTKRFPFLVIFEIQPDEVVVLAVAHVRRRSNFWLRRRNG